MSDVTIRDLRNHGGDVVDRVQRGERLTITRAGIPVAELHPVRRPGLAAAELVARRRNLPRVDAIRLHVDLDEALDATL